MKPNSAFFYEHLPYDNHRRCPICLNYHIVNSETIPLSQINAQANQGTCTRYTMKCPEKNVILEHISLFNAPISEIWFDPKKTVLNEEFEVNPGTKNPETSKPILPDGGTQTQIQF